jgi:hypothetical protein
VIAEIGQERGAGSAHRGMNIAIDPRRRHRDSLGCHFWRPLRRGRKCAADGAEVQG